MRLTAQIPLKTVVNDVIISTISQIDSSKLSFGGAVLL